MELTKSRLMLLMKLFNETTDESHGVSMTNIIAHLNEHGIKAERKAIYRDIAILKEYGYNIQKLKTSPVQYALVNHHFSQAQLSLLMDTVQSSRFLTKRKSDELLRAIKKLASNYQAKALNKHIHVAGRIKMQNESVFSNIDIIQDALAARKKIRFRYFNYGLNKQQCLRRNGKTYTETPVALMFSDGFYYVICYNDKHSSFPTYRADRMVSLFITDEPCTRNERIANFNAADYESCVFSMYSGTPISITLSVTESAMNSIIDRFGNAVEVFPCKEDNQRALVHVRVMESPAFYGWLAQFGSEVLIEKPAAAAKRYADFLEEITHVYSQRNSASCEPESKQTGENAD